MREQMHQYGFVGLRLRRLDAGGRQRKCGHENDEARAYDAKEGVIHGSHRRCNLGFDSTTRVGIGFRLFCRRAMQVPQRELAPAWGERQGHFGVYHGGLIRRDNVGERRSFPGLR